jgi:hypothetical protein
MAFCNRRGGQAVWALSDLQFGEAVPDSAFAVRLPPGVKVRRLEKAETLEWLGRLAGMGQQFLSQLEPVQRRILMNGR